MGVSGYSLNLTGFNIVNYFIRNADYMLVGRFLGAESLGFYTLAYTMLLFPIRNISAVIGRVMFPLYSQIQEDNARMRGAHLKVVGSIALVTFPMMFGLVVLRDFVVLALLGEKWSPVIPLLLYLGPVGLVQSVGTTLGTIYQAKGRTDLMLYWGLGAGILIISAFAVGLHWGILGVAIAYAMITALLFYPGQAIALSLIRLPAYRLLLSLFRPFAASGVMACAVVLVRMILPEALPSGIGLVLCIVVGVIVYGAATWLINRERLLQVVSLLAPRKETGNESKE